ncbi:hypothetical protein PF003_g12768 [Phytophthora fragariae]|nr:hypothetical protein PF003_g12768 [Phytophthora fragariae]
MTVTQEGVEDLSRAIFLPIVLVLDAWVFQYLVSVYWSRRREIRVKMLLVASFLAFVTHIYSHETYETMREFNDISETCLQLTFIIQITIIGRDVAKKVKLRSIVWFTYVAEALILVSWLDVFGSILEIAGLATGGRSHDGIFMRLLIVSCILINVIHKGRRSGRSSFSVRSGKPSTVTEEEAPKPGGSTNSLQVLSSIPAFVRKPSSLRFSAGPGSTRNMTKIAVASSASTRQLQVGNNLDYVVDE